MRTSYLCFCFWCCYVLVLQHCCCCCVCSCYNVDVAVCCCWHWSVLVCRLTGRKLRVMNFGSYNYLGFAENKELCATAVQQVTEEYGIGNCASRQELGQYSMWPLHSKWPLSLHAVPTSLCTFCCSQLMCVWTGQKLECLETVSVRASKLFLMAVSIKVDIFIPALMTLIKFECHSCGEWTRLEVVFLIYK